MQLTQHNEDLDFLKGIGITLVVLGHCFTKAITEEYLSAALCKNIIYTFHMPLFFIVSGYLQGLRPYKINQLKKIGIRQTQKLFLPYIVWSIVLCVFYFLLSSMGIFTVPEGITLNPACLIPDILSYRIITGNVLWFVYILYLISVVSYFIHSLINRMSINIVFIIIVAFIGFAANTYLQDELFVPKRFAVMWIYYETGVFIGKYIKDISYKVSWKLNIAFAALYALSFIGTMNTSGIFRRVLNVLCALIAVFVIYSISKYNETWFYKLFKYIGKRTLYIYYLHNPYIVLILVTGLITFMRVNIVIAIAVSFLLGCIIPLLIGEFVVERVRGLNLIFGRKKSCNLKITL